MAGCSMQVACDKSPNLDERPQCRPPLLALMKLGCESNANTQIPPFTSSLVSKADSQFSFKQAIIKNKKFRQQCWVAMKSVRRSAKALL